MWQQLTHGLVLVRVVIWLFLNVEEKCRFYTKSLQYFMKFDLALNVVIEPNFGRKFVRYFTFFISKDLAFFETANGQIYWICQPWYT
jgi:hypothetical protein